ncbi:lysozyme g-like isoform X2 [Syngnathoides biaculeatus]|nr:lysozyme g-like isoform X2 [Syngnathoides biaculeatus]
MKVETSGASQQTANQDGLHYASERASYKMAQTDLDRMNKYKDRIRSVAAEKGIDAAIIAGIISRECRAGNTLQSGWGDHGNAWGLMQVDKRYHNIQGGWDSKEHLRQATDILIKFINEMDDRRGWSTEQKLKGGIAAYNCGPGAVGSYGSVDANTTGGDYSNDVVARAQWYKNYGGF